MKLRVSFVLLFGVVFVSGSSLRNVKENPDIYGVKDDRITLKFIQPKADQPTLREIIYYHVYERPYGDVKNPPGTEDQSLPITRRPFTNSHGFQFLDVDPEDLVTHQKPLSTDKVERPRHDAMEAVEPIWIKQPIIAPENTKNKTKEEETEESSSSSSSYEEWLPDSNEVSEDTSSSGETEDTSSSGETEEQQEDEDIKNDPKDESDPERKGADNSNAEQDATTEKSDNTEVTEINNVNEITEANVNDGVTDQGTTEEVVDDKTTERTTVNDERDENVDIDVRVKEDKELEKQKAARNRLFNNVKERYHKEDETKFKVLSRHKRASHLSHIPPPPTLPPPNYSNLPDFIRKIVSTENPIQSSDAELTKNSENHKELDEETNHEEKNEPETQEHEIHEEKGEEYEDIIKQEIADKIDEMFTNIEDNLNTAGNDDVSVDDSNEMDEVEDTRTYGMRLGEHGGYVWNDLWSNPGYSFDVGEPEKNKPTVNNPEVPEEPTPDFDILPGEPPSDFDISDVEDADSSDMSQTEEGEHNDPYHDDNVFKPYEPITNTANNMNEVAQKETSSESLDYIFVDIPKLNKKEDEIRGENKESKAKLGLEKDKHIVNKDVKVQNEEENDQFGNVNKSKSDSESVPSKLKAIQTLDDNKQNKNEGNTDTSNQLKKYNSEESEGEKHEPTNIWDELMNNKDFWRWLEQWTELYMEQLIKHIKSIVREEVTRQLNKYNDDAFIKENVDEVDIDKRFKTIDKESERKNSKQKNKEDIQVIPNKDIDTVKEKTADIKEKKLLIDGKEIPVTHTTNFDKHQQKKKGEKDKQITPSKDINELHEKDLKEKKPKIPEIKDQNVLVDGKKIPLTHTTNFDTHKSNVDKSKHNKVKPNDKERIKLPIPSLKPNHQNDKNKTEQVHPVKVENIYGNAVGNEQVTNIFVFYPNKDLPTIIAELSPFNKTKNENDSLTNGEKNRSSEEVKKKKDSDIINISSLSESDRDSQSTKDNNMTLIEHKETETNNAHDTATDKNNVKDQTILASDDKLEKETANKNISAVSGSVKDKEESTHKDIVESELPIKDDRRSQNNGQPVNKNISKDSEQIKDENKSKDTSIIPIQKEIVKDSGNITKIELNDDEQKIIESTTIQTEQERENIDTKVETTTMTVETGSKIDINGTTDSNTAVNE